MSAILRRALVLCAALISYTVAAGPPPVDAFPKRLVAGTPDSAISPSASNAAEGPRQAERFPRASRPTPASSRGAGEVASLDVVGPTSAGIGSKSPTTSPVNLNQANIALSKGTQLPRSSDSLSSAVKAKAVVPIAKLGDGLATFIRELTQIGSRLPIVESTDLRSRRTVHLLFAPHPEISTRARRESIKKLAGDART
jgi:hypothetical protein